MRLTLFSAAAAFLLCLGSAQALQANNQAATTPDAPRSVAGTTAGMPPTAQTMFAVVAASGGLLKGFPAVASSRVSVGQYRVQFPGRTIASCAWIATLGTNNTNIVPASIIQVALGAESTQTVFVAITNAAGTAFVDRPFHLAVHC